MEYVQEYVQLTLDDWLKTKQRLQAELLGVRRSFVRIGYLLRKVDESKGYEMDGYKSVAEWAKGEYGLEGPTVSRFMAINREYSLGGFSEELMPEYEDFKRSQLEEMLKLPEADRQMIRPETPRADIRELKDFNRTAPAAGEADELTELIRKFFEENRDVLKELYLSEAFRAWNIKGMADLVNPSGNRYYRKGVFFLMMYPDKIMLKKFGQESPETIEWEHFFNIVTSLYGTELILQESGSEAEENEIAPAQNPEETTDEKTEEKEGPGQQNTTIPEDMGTDQSEEETGEETGERHEEKPGEGSGHSGDEDEESGRGSEEPERTGDGRGRPDIPERERRTGGHEETAGVNRRSEPAPSGDSTGKTEKTEIAPAQKSEETGSISEREKPQDPYAEPEEGLEELLESVDLVRTYIIRKAWGQALKAIDTLQSDIIDLSEEDDE